MVNSYFRNYFTRHSGVGTKAKALKKEIESPKLSESENIVIDTSAREKPTTEMISGSFEGMNKRLPLKTKVKEGGSKVYRRSEEVSNR